MPRTPYPDPEAEKAYQSIVDGSSKAEGYKQLSNEMQVDKYTNGTVSGRQAAEAQSIDERVRRKR